MTETDDTRAKALTTVLDAARSWLDELSEYIIPSAVETCGDDASGYQESYDKLGAAINLLEGRPKGDQGLNIDPAYWTTNLPHAVDALSELTGKSEQEVAEELAGIAEDRSHVPDTDVLATFRADNDLPELPEEFEEKREALARMLMDLSYFPSKWDVVANEIERANLSDDIELRDNYLKDADEVLRSQPHLLGLGTREQMGLWK